MVFNYLSTSETWPDKRGDNLVVFNYLSTSETWPDKRGDNLVVFNYLSTSETWPDKRGTTVFVKINTCIFTYNWSSLWWIIINIC